MNSCVNMQYSGDKKQIVKAYRKDNERLLNSFEKNCNTILFEKSIVCSSMFTEYMERCDKLRDGSKVHYSCKGCTMTKSLMPSGKFIGYDIPIECTNIVVQRILCGERISYEYTENGNSSERKTLETCNKNLSEKFDKIRVLDHFTLDVLINWFIENILFDAKLKTALQIHYAYICNGFGYKVIENTIPFYESNLENINLKHILIQLLYTFKKLMEYGFSWGTPNVKNLYLCKRIPGSNIPNQNGERYTTVLMDHSKSAITVNGIRYVPNMSKTDFLKFPVTRVDIKISRTESLLAFRVKDDTTYQSLKTKDSDIFGSQYDFYSLITSMMMWKDFRNIVLSSELKSMWINMWESSEYESIMKFVERFEFPEDSKSISKLLCKATLHCNVIEQAIGDLKR